jgi:hypothetical protein
MLGMLELLLYWLGSLVKSRRRLEAENLALRHQVNILRRRVSRRLWLSNADRLAFVWLYRLCPSMLDAVAIVPVGRSAEISRYLVRDRDAVYGHVVRRRLRALGIRDRPTAARSPWQNAYVEGRPYWPKVDDPFRI